MVAIDLLLGGWSVAWMIVLFFLHEQLHRFMDRCPITDRSSPTEAHSPPCLRRAVLHILV